MVQPCKLICIVMFLSLLILTPRHAQAQEYQNAIEAWNAGVAQLRARNYAASQAPFEAALKLAENDEFRLKIYEALLNAYRQLGEPDKFFEACDYIIDHASYPAKKSLTRRSLIAFAHQRGKSKDLAKQYEQQLEAGEDPETALYVLIELYARSLRQPESAIKYTEQYAEVLKESGEELTASEVANLGMQYIAVRKFDQAAAYYEQAAGLDESLASYHWKEAASAWHRAGKNEKALNAVQKAEDLGPDARSEQLTYYWHKSLADLNLELDHPQQAISHYEQAMLKTKIEGYLKSCREGLEKARAAVN